MPESLFMSKKDEATVKSKQSANSERLFIIDKSMIDQFYSPLTGFKRSQSAEDYIF